MGQWVGRWVDELMDGWVDKYISRKNLHIKVKTEGNE